MDNVNQRLDLQVVSKCPVQTFTCREAHRKQESTRRSVAYYRGTMKSGVDDGLVLGGKSRV